MIPASNSRTSVVALTAVRRATAPIVGLPYDGGCFRVERKLLQTVLTCPALNYAAITADGRLRLWGKGAEYTLKPLYSPAQRDGNGNRLEPWDVKETLTKWAASQRKRPKATEANGRQRVKLQAQIDKLKRQRAKMYVGEPPIHPLLETASAYSAGYQESQRENWLAWRAEKPLRVALAHLYPTFGEGNWAAFYKRVAVVLNGHGAGFVRYGEAQRRAKYDLDAVRYLKSLPMWARLTGKPGYRWEPEGDPYAAHRAAQIAYLARVNEAANLDAMISNLEAVLKEAVQ